MLAALALHPGGRARRVLDDLDIDIAAIKRELRPNTTCSQTRPARWWKRRSPIDHGFSFYGRSGPAAGELVDGPGVAMCSNCVALASDILDEYKQTR